MPDYQLVVIKDSKERYHVGLYYNIPPRTFSRLEEVVNHVSEFYPTVLQNSPEYIGLSQRETKALEVTRKGVLRKAAKVRAQLPKTKD